MTTVFMRLAAAAAIASFAAPVIAQSVPANPAAKLSVAGPVRAGAQTAKSSKIAPVLINIAILAALTGGVLIATTTGDDDDSDSN